MSEIKVEPYWNADTLMAAVIGNIVRTLELGYPSKIKNNNRFAEAKSIIGRITETFSSFRVDAFGVK